MNEELSIELKVIEDDIWIGAEFTDICEGYKR